MGVELELAGGRVERVVLRVLVEAAHARQLVAPVLLELGIVETLFDEGVPIDLGGEVRIGEAVLEPLVGGHAEVELFALAKAIEYFEGDFPVGLRDAHAVACVRGVARPAHADGHRCAHGVIVFEACGDGKYQVSEERVVLHPLMIGDEELHLVAADGVLELEAAVPAVHVAGLFGPKHVHGVDARLLGGNRQTRALRHGLRHHEAHLRIARVGELLELLVGRHIDDAGAAVPLDVAVADGFGDGGAGQALGGGIEHAAVVEQGERASGGLGEFLLGYQSGLEVQLLDAGLAHALHGEQVRLRAARLVGVGGLDGA